MDLNFYSDLTDGTGHVDSSEFLNPQSYNGYDSVNKFSAGNENYLTISGAGHPFLSTEQTFHTPSLGDEEFEIPPISLDPDATLTIEDVEAHFGELADGSGSIGGGGETDPRNAVVGGGKDPSFASTFVNPAATQGLEHLTVGVMNHPGGGALLGVDLGSSPLGSSSPMTIDVPLNDMNHSLLGHGQLTTIDQSELNAHLGLGLGAGPMLTRSKSPDQPLSAMPSPVGSLQDEEMEDFRQTTLLVDCDVSLSPSPLMVAQLPMQIDSSLPAPAVRRVGGKPAMVAMSTGGAGAPLVVKKGRKRRDPNEPAKPVSAYALFFRDTQAAIKGQNPSATFGEVSRIVASMWDSLAEEQKQVYKRKTEAAKKAYLQALAAYRAKHLSAPAGEVTEAPPPVRLAPPLDQNTITNICASNIILDLPQVTTRSRTGALPLVTATAPTPAPPTAITKIIISKQMLRQIPSSMVTVIPAAGMRSLQASVVSSSASQSATGAGRQPPPLQQMLSPPPPPRLQQMVHSTAPPPLQAKPRGGVGTPLSILASAPPPLQIKVIPASSQANEAVPIIVTTTTKSTNDLRSAPSASALDCTGLAPAMGLQVVHSATGTRAEEAVVEQLTSGQVEMEVEVDVAATPALLVSTLPGVCVRAGCNKPAVDSRDWDKEYCSNECVATHCREVFMAWCAIRSQNPTAVK